MHNPCLLLGLFKIFALEMLNAEQDIPDEVPLVSKPFTVYTALSYLTY